MTGFIAGSEEDEDAQAGAVPFDVEWYWPRPHSHSDPRDVSVPQAPPRCRTRRRPRPWATAPRTPGDSDSPGSPGRVACCPPTGSSSAHGRRWRTSWGPPPRRRTPAHPPLRPLPTSGHRLGPGHRPHPGVRADHTRTSKGVWAIWSNRSWSHLRWSWSSRATVPRRAGHERATNGIRLTELHPRLHSVRTGQRRSTRGGVTGPLIHIAFENPSPGDLGGARNAGPDGAAPHPARCTRDL